VNESVVERRTESRVIRMKNVTCEREGIPIFYNFSATFMSNRINTIVGKNGSGKTQIFRLLSGYDIPTNGHLFLDNVKLLCSEEYHQGQVVYASIDTIAFPEMTVSNYYRYLAIFKNNLH
jgi:ABC-type multidrug transport system ATPase subunit